jgi:hypothetical protein
MRNQLPANAVQAPLSMLVKLASPALEINSKLGTVACEYSLDYCEAFYE